MGYCRTMRSEPVSLDAFSHHSYTTQSYKPVRVAAGPLFGSTVARRTSFTQTLPHHIEEHRSQSLPWALST